MVWKMFSVKVEKNKQNPTPNEKPLLSRAARTAARSVKINPVSQTALLDVARTALTGAFRKK